MSYVDVREFHSQTKTQIDFSTLHGIKLFSFRYRVRLTQLKYQNQSSIALDNVQELDPPTLPLKSQSSALQSQRKKAKR
jgi:hypothetical protein